MNVQDHEKLFDDICGKLNELSRIRPPEETVQGQEKIDRLQTQIKKFQTDLQDTQVELREKIKSLENVHVSHGDHNQQLKTLTDQLNNERTINTKLNMDLAKSLEVSLQLQLEIQGLKSRSQQVQNDERKFSQTLQEKMRISAHELELAKALNEEMENELNKARARVLELQEISAQEQQAKQAVIDAMSFEMEGLSTAFAEMQQSSEHQNMAMKNLSEVAENKIVELKMAFDRKSAECRDFEGHLHQAITQSQLMKQENATLKDYIAKMNVYLQSTSGSSAAPTTAPVNATEAPASAGI